MKTRNLSYFIEFYLKMLTVAAGIFYLTRRLFFFMREIHDYWEYVLVCYLKGNNKKKFPYTGRFLLNIDPSKEKLIKRNGVFQKSIK